MQICIKRTTYRCGSFYISWEQRKVSEIAFRFDNLRVPVAANLRVSGNTPYYGANGIQDYVDGFTHEGEFVLVAEDGANDLKNYPVKCVNGRIWVNNHAHVLQGKPEIAVNRFLAYAISQANIEALLVGGGRAKLNAETMMGIELYIPVFEEQKIIGDCLASLDNLITLHQRKEFMVKKDENDQIEFKKLTHSWEQRKLGEISEKVTEKNVNNEFSETLTNSAEYGVISQREFFEHDIAKAEKLNGYYVVRENYFVYNPRISVTAPVGPINRNKCGKMGVMSPLYTVFRVSGVDFCYLEQYFKSKHWHGYMRFNGDSGARADRFSIKNELFFAMPINLPQYLNQVRIGRMLELTDNLITLHQRKYDVAYEIIKSIHLGDNYRKMTINWEQRKLDDLVERVVRKNTNNESTLPLTISAQYGLVDQFTYFNNRVASRDVSNYYLLYNGEFAYNKSTSDGFPFGTVKRLDFYEKGVLSTLYIVFSIKKENLTDSNFLTVFFDTDRWHKGISERAAEGARNHGLLNISADDFFDIDLTIPRNKNEQIAIGKFIRCLDNLITLHQRRVKIKKRSFL